MTTELQYQLARMHACPAEPDPSLAEIARDLYLALRDLYEHTDARCVTVGDCNAARRALDQAEGRT